MDPISERNLATLDPVLAEKIRAAAAEYEESGFQFCVYDGLRTAEQQNALWAKGRTAPGAIVTNAKAGDSNHNYGMAADIVPFLAPGHPSLNWNPVSAQYKAMVAVLKAHGLVWGGDWTHFKDLDHFQLASIPANPSSEMKADYNNGMSLPEIWAKYG